MSKVTVNKPKPQPPITFTIEDISIEEMETLAVVLGMTSIYETPAAEELYSVVNAALNTSGAKSTTGRSAIKNNHVNYLRRSYGGKV